MLRRFHSYFFWESRSPIVTNFAKTQKFINAKSDQMCMDDSLVMSIRLHVAEGTHDLHFTDDVREYGYEYNFDFNWKGWSARVT